MSLSAHTSYSPNGTAEKAGQDSPHNVSTPTDSNPQEYGNKKETDWKSHRHGAMRKFLLASDLFLVWVSAGAIKLAFALFNVVGHETQQSPFPAGSVGFLLCFSVLIVLFAHAHGLYNLPWKTSLPIDLTRFARSVLSATLVAGGCVYLWHVPAAPIGFIALTVFASWASLSAWRTFIRSQSIAGLTAQKNILIVGCGPNGEQLRRHIERNSDLGYVFKGYVDRRKDGREPDPARNKEEGSILGPIESLPSILRANFIDEVFISVPSDRHLVKEVAQKAELAGLHVRVIPDLYDGLIKEQQIEYVAHFPTMSVNPPSIPILQLVVKRIVDIVVSAILLALLAPLFLLIALIIKMDSKGSVLYRSLRVGKKGATFVCYKFRTMVADAEAQKEKLKHLNQRKDILFKIDADPRLTRAGRILRKFSLDELPQLWNVLKQDMSLVGPRPCIPGEYSQYALEHLRRLDVTPGVTGLWQVMARRDPSFESYITLDNQYVNGWSLGLDCKILWKTISVVLSGTGQ